MSELNQTWYGVSPVYLESKTERIFGIDCLGKKLVFHTEICYYFKKIILKKGLFRRVKELSKVNQTGYGVYNGCRESKTERIFGIACLGKKLVFHTEICYYFKDKILKICLFRLVKELFKVNQTGHGVYHGCLESKTEKNFWYSLSRKKVSFSYGNWLLIQINNFKNRSFSSGQGVVQS